MPQMNIITYNREWKCKVSEVKSGLESNSF